MELRIRSVSLSIPRNSEPVAGLSREFPCGHTRVTPSRCHMKRTSLFLAVLSLITASAFAAEDANHEVIEKVMKEGMKGDSSLHAKVVGGSATAKETKKLSDLLHTLTGTKAPLGEQSDYDKKVAKLLAGIDAIQGGNKSPEALAAYKEAGNCKSCHSAHKPK